MNVAQIDFNKLIIAIDDFLGVWERITISEFITVYNNCFGTRLDRVDHAKVVDHFILYKKRNALLIDVIQALIDVGIFECRQNYFKVNKSKMGYRS